MESVLNRLRTLFRAEAVVQRVGITAGEFTIASSEQDPDAVSAYVSHYCGLDPWVNSLHKKTKPGVINCDALIRYDDLVRTEFYNDFLAKHDMHWGAAAIIDPTPTVASYLTVMRAKQRGDFDAGHLRQLQQLMPHLQTATHIQHRLSHCLTTNARLEQSLDALYHGILLLNGKAEVIHANRAADRLLSANQMLGLRHGHLRVQDGATDKVLQGIISRASLLAHAPLATRMGAVRIEAIREEDVIEVLVAPFMADGNGEALDAVAIVFLNQPRRETPGASAFLRSRYGLTEAETRCALALAAGASIEEIAQSCEISKYTVRAHLRAVHLKAAVKRQGALVAKLNRDLALLHLLAGQDAPANA